MEALFDVAFALVAGGFRLARREPRPVERVAPSPWLIVAMAVVLAQGVLVGAATAVFARGVFTLANDDMLFFLGLILLPIAIAGIAAAVAVLGWMVALLRKLDRRDMSARIELGVLGAGAVFVSVPLFQVTVVAVVVALLGGADVAIAVAPAAWRRPSPARPRQGPTV